MRLLVPTSVIAPAILLASLALAWWASTWQTWLGWFGAGACTALVAADPKAIVVAHHEATE